MKILSLAALLGMASCAIVMSARAADDVRADNVLVVLDASGSMNEDMPGSRQAKMAVARSALIEVAGKIPPGTNVGVLVFTENLKDDLIYPLGPIDMDRFTAAVKKPTARGGTPLGAYLKKAADLLLEQREKQHGYGTYRLLVVSDGEATDQDQVDQFLPEILARGIIVEVIGVAMKEDLALATRVHKYRRADRPQELAQELQQVFAEVGSNPNDRVDQSSFDLLAPIPDEMAAAILGAIASPPNHPIGAPELRGPSAGIVDMSSGQPVSSTPPALPANAPPNGGGFASSFVWIAVLLVFVIVLKSVFRLKRAR
jgi:uncharacterized protein YegL